MTVQERTLEVIRRLKECLEKDPVRASFVDLTALGIAEVTREKRRRPLREIMGSHIL